MARTSPLIKSLLFVALLLATDFISGRALRASFESSRDLGITRLNHAFERCNEDILIYGSSRALHHFVPGIISEKTHKSVYNCGFQGQGLRFCYLQLRHITTRYTPERIVLEISPNILTDTLSDGKLNLLLPFAEKDSAIMNALTGNKISEKTKFVSRIYPYNSMIYDLLYSYRKFTRDSFAGFIPLYATMNTRQVSQNSSDPASTTTQDISGSLYFLNKIIELCAQKSIRPELVISPVFYLTTEEDKIISEVKRWLVNHKTASLKDYSKFGSTYQKPEFFKDRLHLSKQGAYLFSEEIASFVAGPPTPSTQNL